MKFFFLSLSLSLSLFLSLFLFCPGSYQDFFFLFLFLSSSSFDPLQRFLHGGFFSVFLSVPSLIIRPCLFARPFIQPLSLFPPFLILTLWTRGGHLGKLPLRLHFISSRGLFFFPSDIFCFSLDESIPHFCRIIFPFSWVFFRIFRQVSFSHCVGNSNDGIGFSDLWGYATVRLVFRRRFHVAGQTSGCLTRLRHTAPVQLALPQKKRCNFNYVATFLIIHLTELYTKTCYELYNPL